MSFKTAFNYLARLINYLFSAIKYLLLLLLAIIVIIVIVFIPSLKDLKEVAENSLVAKTNLEESISSLKDLDLVQSIESSEKAKRGFSDSLIYLEKISQRSLIKLSLFLVLNLMI